MATKTCPSCGATDYGTPFCVSCQKPMHASPTFMSGTARVESPRERPVVRAGFFRRLVAFALDWLTLSIIADIVSFAYRFGSSAEREMLRMDIAMGFSAALFLLYFTLFTGEGGQTLGKMVLGIRVQGTDGSPVGYGRAFVRTLGYIVSFFFTTFLGFLWVLWDRKKQAWHDKIAGTEVVKV